MKYVIKHWVGLSTHTCTLTKISLAIKEFRHMPYVNFMTSYWKIFELRMCVILANVTNLRVVPSLPVLQTLQSCPLCRYVPPLDLTPLREVP